MITQFNLIVKIYFNARDKKPLNIEDKPELCYIFIYETKKD